jgi:hypothetical protein
MADAPRRRILDERGMSSGNTWGKVVGDSPKSTVKADAANPPVDETNILEEAQASTQSAIDDWVESTGYNQGAMVAGAIATAVVEVFMPTAWWELIPVAKTAKILKKGGEMVVGTLKKSKEEVVGVLKKGKEEVVEALKKVEDTAKAVKDAKKAKSGGGGKDTQVKKKKPKKTGEKGKCGEWLAQQDMMIEEGFDEVMQVQNNSGHGIDLIGRNSKTGEVTVWEVKTTDGARAGSLSKRQEELGGQDFTKDRLGRAAGGKGNYGKVPEAVANAKKVKIWLEDAGKVTYEKREVFIDDIEKGCAKHPNRPSRSKDW